MHRIVMFVACAICTVAASAAELDSVVLHDGTVLRGTVVSCAEEIRFVPHGTEAEIAIDAREVRAVALADGGHCPATPRVAVPEPAKAATPPAAAVRRWYGGNLVWMDLGAAALGILSLTTGVRSASAAGIAVGALGGTLYVIGRAVEHALHAGTERALLSGLIRLERLFWGLPLATCFPGSASLGRRYDPENRTPRG